jgi:hypothetical protein
MVWRDEPSLAFMFSNLKPVVEPEPEPEPVECLRCKRPVTGDRCKACRAIQSKYKGEKK